ncbi:MAG TPA: hypothetical protein VJU18_10250 [Vicinamibacteria bacterium]|nr:hypothetical protein [Vicinamibacteria bacterium]
MAIPARACANHSDRPGHAVCMACRKVVCRECATEWDGINHCVTCLAARRHGVRTRSSSFVWVSVLLASGLLFLATIRLMVWTGVFLAGLS